MADMTKKCYHSNTLKIILFYFNSSEDGTIAQMDKRTRKVVKRLSQPFNAVGAYPMCMSLIDNGCNCLVVGDKTGNLHLIGNILKRKLKFPLPLNLIH